MIAGKKDDQYMLRLPRGLRDRIAKRADKNGRSMNTEIIAAIEAHLKTRDRFALVASAVVELSQIVADLAGEHSAEDGVGIERQAIALEARLEGASLCDP
jgi:predicted DNA-binding protein